MLIRQLASYDSAMTQPLIQPVAEELKSAKLLSRAFYERDPVVVSRELLGKILIRRSGRILLSARIVETEAYLGVEDAAAHSHAGLTERTRVLFGPAGHAYVYFIYGVHHCLNFSCMREGDAGCTLVRAAEPMEGVEEMRHARRLQDLRQLTNGPGKLCQAFGITRLHDNAKDVCDPMADLQVWDDGCHIEGNRVASTQRIGITKAVELPLRFAVRGNGFVSRKVP